MIERIVGARPDIPGGWDCPLPPMTPIRQSIPTADVDDPAAALRGSLDRLPPADLAGKRLAVTVGSRGIPNLPDLVKALVAWLTGRGAEPFIVPSMGSHGGATAEGQRAILEKLGVTAQTVGAPISVGMETVFVGKLDDGTRLYCDRHAFEADGIVLFNKVKPHTSFKGVHESGLMKMSVIGLGKADGARAFHGMGYRKGGERLERAARHQLDHLGILFGVAVVENARGAIAAVAAADRDDIPALDARLLGDAKRSMGGLPFKEIDVLVVDNAGKNYSGTCIDPNVTGRPGVPWDVPPDQYIEKLVVLRLSPESKGNATGLGVADIITASLAANIDFHAMYTNNLAASSLVGCRLPLVLGSDRDAIVAAVRTCFVADPASVRIVRIPNTKHLDTVLVSQALLADVADRGDLEVTGPPEPWTFDESGHLAGV